MASVRIAVDAASGDCGVEVVIRGVLEARSLAPGRFSTVLCGDAAQIRVILDGHGIPAGESDIRIVHCDERISGEEALARVWKTKPGSSIIRCIGLQKEGQADASVSAGNSGILMAAAIFILGRRDGVTRPALAAVLPTIRGRPALLLDVGANLNCKAEHLVSFGLSGSRYFRSIAGDGAVPRVGLLNVGKERDRGTTTVSKAFDGLQKACPGFTGFIEGSDVLAGAADVVVCDGFAGNILLKACESFLSLTESILKSMPDILETIRETMSILKSDNYGAAPLVGINGTVLKAHGNSSARAIASAIMAACVSVTGQPFAAGRFELAKGL